MLDESMASGVGPVGREHGADEVPLLGAQPHASGTRFGLYATTASKCSVRFYTPDGGVVSTHAMELAGRAGSSRNRHGGYHFADVTAVRPGVLYKYVLDDQRELPDPYARFLPYGVYGPSMVVDSAYPWKNGPGLSRPLSDYIVYELHVGTFSSLGTYRGVLQHLGDLRSLGVTAVELMPIAAFAGQRGWGYDGVAWFAPHAPYGTPDDLRALVDALHGAGISVILDVVCNHFGPAGNHLREFSPDYFTSATKNAWGDSLNYAYPPMRRLIIDTALYWLREFRFDGLRLDAIDAIVDPSPVHILREMTVKVAELSPKRLLIAEDSRNDPALVTDVGLDALWADDFHHAVHAALTAEQEGYYAGFEPSAATVAECINNGWLYRGQPYPAWQGPRGKPADGLAASSFLYCIQNHDQVGNRALGERLSTLVSPEQYRSASMLLLFLPMTPLLFMGQEWAAQTPFLYFTDHEPKLGVLICEGRRQEFREFSAFKDPRLRDLIPDPQHPDTFTKSRLVWNERGGEAKRTLGLYRSLIALRKSDPVLKHNTREGLSAQMVGGLLVVERRQRDQRRLLVMSFSDQPQSMPPDMRPDGRVHVLLSSDGRTEASEVLPGTAVILAVDR